MSYYRSSSSTELSMLELTSRWFDGVTYGIVSVFSIQPLWVTGTATISLILALLLSWVFIGKLHSVIGLRLNKPINRNNELKHKKQMDNIARAMIGLSVISYVFTVFSCVGIFTTSGLLIYAVLLFLWLILPPLLWLRRAYKDRSPRNLIILQMILQISLYAVILFTIFQLVVLGVFNTVNNSNRDYIIEPL